MLFKDEKQWTKTKVERATCVSFPRCFILAAAICWEQMLFQDCILPLCRRHTTAPGEWHWLLQFRVFLLIVAGIDPEDHFQFNIFQPPDAGCYTCEGKKDL